MVRTATGALLACAMWWAPAQGAQPYFTDDARIVAHRSCQFEAGKRVFRGSGENWLLPACNFTGSMELLLGRSETTDVAGAHDPKAVMQAKGLLRELAADDYGLAWSAAVNHRLERKSGQQSVPEYRGNFVLSRAFGDETFVLHVNVGASRERDEGKTAGTWGVAGEWNVSDRVALIAEVHDTSRTRRAYQAGVWFALVPDRMELNISVGGDARAYSTTRYWTVGLRFATPAFLP